MRNGLGAVQSAVVLGGGSDIAAATMRRLAAERCDKIMLGVRNPDAVTEQADELRGLGAHVEVTRYDATSSEATASVLDAAQQQLGDIDLVLVAFGLLGSPFDLSVDDAEVAEVTSTNYQAAVQALLSSARTLRTQGHGSLVLLSSVAAARVRKGNALYGASKAGVDRFALALDHELAGSGVHLMIVRPGFVHTKMTADVDPAPFATTAEAVAQDIERGLTKGARTVWSPRHLQPVFGLLSHLPESIWRRVMER